MKRLIVCALALLFPFAGFCQTDAAPAAANGNSAKNEWLKAFTAVEVNGAMNIELVQVPASEAPKIVYDTKGSYTTKFTFEIKDNTLRIYERVDSRRPERTTVTLYYNTLESLSLTEATATFRDPVAARLFDLTVGPRVLLHATLDVQDLHLELSGRESRVVLEGKARYMTLSVSNGTVDALGLDVMAARANVSSGGAAFVDVTERLEVSTSTNGRLNYKSEPAILRSESRFMGGDVGLYRPQ